VNERLRKFDAFEGKATPTPQPTRTRRMMTTRRSSKREGVLAMIREGSGLARGEILEKMGLKNDKSSAISLSNAPDGADQKPAGPAGVMANIS
jgi:hypothetical protein